MLHSRKENDFLLQIIFELVGPQATSQTANLNYRDTQKVWPMAQDAHGLDKQCTKKRGLPSSLTFNKAFTVTPYLGFSVFSIPME